MATGREDAAIAPRVLDGVVTNKDIAIIAQNYLEKWETLSPFLELTNADEAIRRNNHDYEEQKRAFLRRWKKERAATYTVLIKAAKEARNKMLADAIEVMLRDPDRKQLDSSREAPHTVGNEQYSLSTVLSAFYLVWLL